MLAIRDAVLEGLCSALRGLLRLVHLTGTVEVVQSKAPAGILVYKPSRVTELDQFPKQIDVFALPRSELIAQELKHCKLSYRGLIFF